MRWYFFYFVPRANPFTFLSILKQKKSIFHSRTVLSAQFLYSNKVPPEFYAAQRAEKQK